ncbi:MAG: hypothetical protein WAN32_02580, partial [Candidatus Acidiferrum sp.]
MKRLLLLFVACSVGWAAGCSNSGSSSVVTPPPPTGFSNSNLSGTYVFSVTGTTLDNNSATGVSSFSRVGVFTADGKGDISATGGLEDDYMFGSDNLFGIIGGSYVISSDGRGVLYLETSGGTVQYNLSLVSSSTGYMVDMGTGTGVPPATISDTETANGSFQLQTATTLSPGTYVFDFSGTAPASGDVISVIGDFVPNGSSFSPGSYEDVNDNGTIISKAIISGGGYQTDTGDLGTGRGTATIGTSNYVYYVIDSQHVQLMETDLDLVVAGTNLGEAVAQQAGTPNSLTAFNGSSFVFEMGGSDANLNPFTRAGRLTATGGSLGSILLDQNDAGTSQSVPASGVLSAGTVTLDGDNTGRGTFTFTDTVNHTGTYTFVFYLNSATQGVIQDITTVNGVTVDVMDGTLLAQTGSPFSSSSLATSYAIDWSGADPSEEDFVGSFTPASTNPNGLLDYNEFSKLDLFT